MERARSRDPQSTGTPPVGYPACDNTDGRACRTRPGDTARASRSVVSLAAAAPHPRAGARPAQVRREDLCERADENPDAEFEITWRIVTD